MPTADTPAVEAVARIGALVATQNNRCTADPLFVVFDKQRIYGMDTDYTDNIAWLYDDECVEVEPKKARALHMTYCRTWEVPKGYKRVGYVDVDRFVTACFTEAGAQAYIDGNRHNLHKPFIYAASLYRNREMIEVRRMLLDAGRSALSQAADGGEVAASTGKGA